MKNLKPKLILVFTTLLIIYSCSQSEQKRFEESASEKSEPSTLISSSAAVENKKDSTRKFIRTAELKFKVKSVIKSTYDIEDITNKQGGFVTYTNLTSNINNVVTTAISADSTLETTYYTVVNDITVRIPNTKLDTTLKEIARNIDFLDYRIIKAEDVALQVLANNLTQKRAEKHEVRLTNAIDNKVKKLKETTNAEALLLSQQEQGDNAKIANLSLHDKINFSTIQLSIYQRATLKRELIFNDKNIDSYEPSFGTKLIDAVKFGWVILEAFLVFLTKLWGLFLFIIIGYFLFKKIKQKFKK